MARVLRPDESSCSLIGTGGKQRSDFWREHACTGTAMQCKARRLLACMPGPIDITRVKKIGSSRSAVANQRRPPSKNSTRKNTQHGGVYGYDTLNFLMNKHPAIASIPHHSITSLKCKFPVSVFFPMGIPKAQWWLLTPNYTIIFKTPMIA